MGREGDESEEQNKGGRKDMRAKSRKQGRRGLETRMKSKEEGKR